MKRLFFLAIASVMAISAMAQHTAEPVYPVIPTDPAVRMGKLANGMRYYIRHNDKQKNLADFHIVHNVGAIQEADNQQGDEKHRDLLHDGFLLLLCWWVG